MLLETPICDFGWPAPDFTLKDPNDRSFTMKDQLGDKGLLIAFICNHCPYVQKIAVRLAADTSELMAEGVNVLAVMSNDYNAYAEDSPAKMLEFASHHGFEFPYLVDEDQSVGKAYGAVCTPDFYGFNKDGGLQYRGQLDDSRPGNGIPVTGKDMRNALDAMLENGQISEVQKPSIGCNIKWKM